MKKTSYSASIVLKQHLTGIVVALGLTFQTLPALAASGDVYYVHSDHLDTPRQLTNQQNQAVWQNTPLTEPFGTSAPDEDPGNTGTPFTFNLRFPGQYYDQETGTHYNYYRDHYFPGLGRYGQSDPIGLYGGINTYAYVSGNPLLLTDSFGLRYTKEECELLEQFIQDQKRTLEAYENTAKTGNPLPPMTTLAHTASECTSAFPDEGRQLACIAHENAHKLRHYLELSPYIFFYPNEFPSKHAEYEVKATKAGIEKATSLYDENCKDCEME